MTARSDRDKKMWESWDAKGRGGEDENEHWNPLFNAMKPLAHGVLRPHIGAADIPRETMLNKAYDGIIEGLHTYDPTHTSGAAVHTHVTNKIKDSVMRFLHQHRGPGHRMSEARGYSRIPQFQNAAGDLEDELGREPTLSELHERLRADDPRFWTKPEVERMHTDLRLSQPGVGATIEENVAMRDSKEQAAIREVRFQLTDPVQREVLDGLLVRGENGQQLTQRLKLQGHNVNEGKISRIRQQLTKMLDREMQRRR